MSRIDEVRKAMQDAMKAKDKDRKDALSMLLAALKNKAIDKRADLTPEEENEGSSQGNQTDEGNPGADPRRPDRHHRGM